MVNQSGLVLIVLSALVLVITLGLVTLSTPMIYIPGLNAPIEDHVTVKPVFAPVILAMMALHASVSPVLITVTKEVHAGLRSIWL